MDNEIINKEHDNHQHQHQHQQDDKIILPWVEKYRPTVLDDIVGNKNIIYQFKVIAETGNIPHMILAGHSGTGKTTSIICLAKILLKENFREGFLELNASVDRGIETIRNMITTFCKKKINLNEGINKIIFLDEFDSMTPTAQHALRRIIELYSSSTRFVMACNTSSRIIEAIQSRCSVIKFSKISKDEMMERIIKICEMEKIEWNDEGIEELISTTDGDMRKCINNLQAVSIGYEKITLENVKKIIDKPDEKTIRELLEYCFNKNFDEVHRIVNELNENGYSALDIIQSIFTNIKNMDINTDKKIKYLIELGNTQMYLINGGDYYIQIMALLCRIIELS